MGKASRWFRALLGSKKSSPGSPKAKKSNARKSGDVSRGTHSHGNGGDASTPNSYPSEALDANKHAIAVAAATAAVAEAALAAAQAAAEVVRLTSGNRTAPSCVSSSSSSNHRREWAAVKIQSGFRAYLARRALRALKGLVKLQALVRGRIVRKQSADMLRRMQAMARIQARACANRSLVSDASHPHTNTSKIHHRGSSSLSKFDYLQQQQQQQHSSSTIHGSNIKRCYSKSNKAENMSMGRRMDLGSKWLDHWMEEYARNNSYLLNMGRGYDDGEKSDKILEIDNGQGSRTYYNNSMSSSNNLKKPNPASPSSGEVSSSSQSVKFPREVNQEGKWVVDQSPSAGFHFSSKHGGSSRSQRGGGGGGPFTPNRSECTRSLCFSDFPNYMANTQSSSAKVRSLSAPRQRMQQKLVTGRDTDTVSEKSWSIRGNFMGKGYTGSGRMVMQTQLSS